MHAFAGLTDLRVTTDAPEVFGTNRVYLAGLGIADVVPVYQGYTTVARRTVGG
jgi:hypothetical protein